MNDAEMQKRLDECHREIGERLGPPARFLVTHFSWGRPGDAGYLIKSSASAEKCAFADWARSCKKAADQELVHRQVIIMHARQFQRGLTVPAFLAGLCDRWKVRTFVKFTVLVTEQVAPVDVGISTDPLRGYIECRLSRRFAKTLCPAALMRRYFDPLYQAAVQSVRDRRDPDREKLGEERFYNGELRPFDLPRYEAFAMLARKKPEEALSRALSLMPERKNSKLQAWSLVCMLQSALLYFRAGCESLGKGGREEARDVRKVSGFAYAFPMDVAPAAFGYVLGSRPPERPHQGLANAEEFVGHEFRQFWKATNLHVAGTGQGFMSQRVESLRDAVARAPGFQDARLERSQNPASLLTEQIEDAVKGMKLAAGVTERMTLIAHWAVYLITRLHGARHEGKKADFWFVIGQPAEFADDRDVILDKILTAPKNLQEGMNDVVRAPDASTLNRAMWDTKFAANGKGLIPAVCESVVRSLEKEHYPWFHKGRHALLFDTSSDELIPYGLAELRSGSWSRVVAESFKLPHAQRLDIPACLIAFVDGSSGEAGLVYCPPPSLPSRRVPGEESTGDRRERVKRILWWRGSRWQVMGKDGRREALGRILQQQVDWWVSERDKENRERLTDVITTISDDPFAGGTLIFAKSPKGFTSIGAPWQLDKTYQDGLALISHDGATVLWRSRRRRIHRVYRRLLMLPSTGDMSRVQVALERKSLTDGPDFPLVAVGTRRWGAALAAATPSVHLAIAISTDGDITCWWRQKSTHANHDRTRERANVVPAETGTTEMWELKYAHIQVGMPADAVKPEVAYRGGLSTPQRQHSSEGGHAVLAREGDRPTGSSGDRRSRR